MQGAIAAGHAKSAEAAIHILEAGGNAFDAALASLCAACVVEPVLTSLGGGGFLLARDQRGKHSLFDFFVQTPGQKRAESELDFHPIVADFGTAQQEFHVGMGAIAAPGTIRGLFDVHRELGTLPMRTIMEPAIQYARKGTELNGLQAYIFSVVAPIYLLSGSARANYATGSGPQGMLSEGDLFRQPQLADTLEHLSIETDRLFYEGELGQQLIEQCQTRGGQLQQADLTDYRTIRRPTLQHSYRGKQILTNPPPSSGGLLIAFALELLSNHVLAERPFGSSDHLELLARIMDQTNLARLELKESSDLHDRNMLERHRKAILGHLQTSRGTTHISVVDEQGNAAALSLSNGEGCGHMLTGSGIMPNNMLGEDDLNPNGFHQWPTNSRVSSMMAPSMVIDKNGLVVTGSGGSNRLRTAILQTLTNIVDFGMSIDAAVRAPRIHSEKGRISIEPGFDREAIDGLIKTHQDHHLWDDPNLFFGGAHTLGFDGSQFTGAGDPRRGGVFRSTPQ